MALPRPHPLARASLVDRLDRLLSLGWGKGWMPPPPLDPEELIRRGARGHLPEDESGGRVPEDVTDFRERLEALCEAVVSEASLNSVGMAFAYGLMVRAIRQRFALGALWRRNPELPETGIAPPIIVAGQMRSGTTRIHRLLAADPAHASTRFCDSWHPVPEKPDFRPLRGGLQLFMARRLDPWIDTIHPFSAARADEELGWLAGALDHSAYEAQWHIPSFTGLGEARDPAPIYRELARILRTDAAHRGNAGRPRVLKTPQFAEDLAAILEQFPNARLVISRRCDRETLRSSVSLVANQMAIQSDKVDLDVIETEWERKLALRSDRMAAGLAGFKGPVAEVHFDELGANWQTEIERIYAELGLPLSDAAMVAMQREMQAGEAGSHKEHAKHLNEFGKNSRWAA